ncbi:hypothetical protein Pla108_25000 [Botrimarina colliarenosi]|uniref:Uncharacterized protein n=1 Tax=Botrimarina colliarenosi TaxID=2528001 RepID=A0A5C6AB98_9BACT|nr:hypothetical protein [Botrimarina colliarenosi]TWT96726.1 hypothetical protein Pla108_25000 [Botrimarina colliarenosi]
MRLTLRTLLSYLDNVLDEPSRAELQRQIDSSDHASEWVHRTRDVMRRLKLGAPEPAGTGSIDDPNTVAEYLDRTLPEEGVAEFERVCLESDAMLAEVASCHHVLAMFLSEPPQIDPDTRRRLHRLQEDMANALKSRIEQAHPSPGAVAPETPAIEPATPAARRVRPTTPVDPATVPSEGGWSQLAPWAPAIAALLLLAITAVLAIKPNGLFVATPTPGTESSASDTGEEASEGKTPPAANGEGQKDTSAAKEEGVPPGKETTGAAEPSDGEMASPVETPDDGTSVTTGNATDAAEEPTEPTEEEASSPTSPSDEQSEQVNGLGDEQEMAEPALEETDPAETQPAEMEPAETEPEPEPETLTFVGPRDGLVVVEKEEGPWSRLVPGMFMFAPQRAHLVSMPTQRGSFDLSKGVTVELVGQTEAIVDPESPTVELRYGRVVLSHSPEAAEAIVVQVRVDGVAYEASLEPGASVAVAADHFYESGYDMLAEPAPMVMVAHAIEGDSKWSTSSGERTSAMPAPLFFTSGRLSGAPSGFLESDWVSSLDLTASEEVASPVLVGLVAPGAPVWPQLFPIAELDKRQEVRSLAAQCSLALGRPESLVASFGDEVQFRFWDAHLAALRQAAARSTAGAEKVRQAFVEKYGNAGGAAFFEVLTGFTPTQVGRSPEAMQEGVINEKLLPMLRSDELATRVLGSIALDELVEYKNDPFNPLDSELKRRRTLTRIGNFLERGELTPRAAR